MFIFVFQHLSQQKTKMCYADLRDVTSVGKYVDHYRLCKFIIEAILERNLIVVRHVENPTRRNRIYVII